jgi:hypothetical protein
MYECMSRRQRNHPRRNWLEHGRLLTYIGLSYRITTLVVLISKQVCLSNLGDIVTIRMRSGDFQGSHLLLLALLCLQMLALSILRILFVSMLFMRRV